MSKEFTCPNCGQYFFKPTAEFVNDNKTKMRICEKFGFKTARDMISELTANKLVIKAKIDAMKEAGAENVEEYLNQEIETNFEHYKKRFIEFMNSLYIDVFIARGVPMYNFTKFLFDAYECKQRDFDLKEEYLTWLKQEYRP